MNGIPVFGTRSGGMRTGRSGGIGSGVSFGHPAGFMERCGPPELPGHPLVTRRPLPHRRNRRSLARFGIVGLVFGVRRPLDFREVYFSAVLAAAHDFACLRIARPVAGITSYGGRKTGYRPGGADALAGRDSHPLDDCFTFQKGRTSLHPREPASLGRTAQFYGHRHGIGRPGGVFLRLEQFNTRQKEHYSCRIRPLYPGIKVLRTPFLVIAIRTDSPISQSIRITG